MSASCLRWAGLSATIVIAASLYANAKPVFERQDLFTSGDGGYAVYRIPTIVATPRGELLVFCEARKSSSDWGQIDLLMRRSSDGGATWTAPVKLVEPPA